MSADTVTLWFFIFWDRVQCLAKVGLKLFRLNCEWLRIGCSYLQLLPWTLCGRGRLGVRQTELKFNPTWTLVFKRNVHKIHSYKTCWRAGVKPWVSSQCCKKKNSRWGQRFEGVRWPLVMWHLRITKYQLMFILGALARRNGNDLGWKPI